MSDPQRSRELWRKAGTLSPPTGNDLDRAVALLEEAVSVEPRNVLAYHELARLHIRYMNDLDKAMDYIRRGAAVADIPMEIGIMPSIDVPVQDETADDFQHLEFLVALARNDTARANELLARMKAHWDKYGGEGSLSRRSQPARRRSWSHQPRDVEKWMPGDASLGRDRFSRPRCSADLKLRQRIEWDDSTTTGSRLGSIGRDSQSMSVRF